MNKNLQNKSIKLIEDLLGKKIICIEYPKQGADNYVYFITDETGKEYTVKIGDGIENDLLALNMINEAKSGLPVPKVYGDFIIGLKQGLILERYKYPLYRYVVKDYKNNFIKPLIEVFRKIQTIRSNFAGLITWEEKKLSWKDFLLLKYSGKHPWYQWEEIAKRSGVDSQLVTQAVQTLTNKIQETEFISKDYSLLHTDINQGNIFVDIKTKKIKGIIDWSEATFGDPLYDFARFRLNIWHNFNKEATEIYHRVLDLRPADKPLEQLYFYMHVVDYINWFSESNDTERLKLHLDYLRKNGI